VGYEKIDKQCLLVFEQPKLKRLEIANNEKLGIDDYENFKETQR
jgi:hypothetical protein